MNLESLGWTARLADHHATHYPSLLAGRVSAQHRDSYEILAPDGPLRARIDGKLQHAERFPAVGDWVAFAHETGIAVIRAILPRTSVLERKAAGKSAAAQTIAANVDSIFIMNGLDADFSVRRIERYIAIAWEGGAQPVVLLNKADLCDDIAARYAEVQSIAFGVPVHILSLHAPAGIEELQGYLLPGKTIAIVGSSGTGKSTLVNVLRGRQSRATQTVREHDGRGKHTTTARELVPLSNGALLIDTPGMRELQPWNAHDGISQAFDDIESLAASCRFRDCSHRNEPGCAVLDALGTTLGQERLQSYRKLRRETDFLARKSDAGAQAAEKARWKAIHKELRQYMKWRER